MAKELSERIAALRKERGFTQEQLGNMVGVSSQAVSKWEKGGTPDVELLPVLSRQLGVTIDALFGMEGGEQEDPADAVGRWLRGFPAKERLNQFCRLVWRAKQHFLSEADGEIKLPATDYPETAKLSYGDGGALLMLSQIVTEGGIFFDVHAEDLSFATLWPRPHGGWAQWLAPKEEYRRLFAVLAKPGCLELLEYVCNRKIGWFSASVVKKRLDLPREDVESLLESLAAAGLLSSMELELEDGETHVYEAAEPWKLIPFLLLARTLTQSESNYFRLYEPVSIFAPGETWAETGNEPRDTPPKPQKTA